MSQTTVKAWKCDRESCGHVWYTGSNDPPKSCSKCKSKNWNTETIAPLINSGAVKTASQVFSPTYPYARPAHAPGCKCLMCKGK